MACTSEPHIILKLAAAEQIIHCSCCMVLSTGQTSLLRSKPPSDGEQTEQGCDIAGSEHYRPQRFPYCLDTYHAIDKFDLFYP